MGRYVKKFTRVGSMGPTEERGFAVWAGYELVGVDDDLSEHGLIRVDEWPAEVTAVTRVEQDDDELYVKLGIERGR